MDVIEEQDEALQKVWDEMDDEKSSKMKQVWILLKENNKRMDINMSFTNYMEGEPNQDMATCMFLSYSYNGTWGDENCKKTTFPYVCEFFSKYTKCYVE